MLRWIGSWDPWKDLATQGELAMDRNRLLLLGGAIVLALFLASVFAPSGIVPR